MPRIRTIKPQHVNDKELAKVSLQAHLLWVLLWCFSDDEGVFENDPLLIKSQLFPRRTDIRVEQIEQWIGQLVKARFIIPFTHDGEGYYIHRTFKIHQKIDRPQPSKIPEIVIRRILAECSTNVRHCIVEEEESKGEESKPPPASVDSVIYPFGDDFKTQWLKWKNYKKVELKFNYKSIESEQASINDLIKKSAGVEKNAIAIIHQSMANGWKGFFELKEEKNGFAKTGKQPTGADVSTSSIFSKIDAMPNQVGHTG